MDSVCNSHFSGIKSPLSTSKLLLDLLKESIEPRLASHGLRGFVLVDPPIFITLFPGGSVKTRPADQLDLDVVDHRALLVNTHGKQCCYPFMMDIVAVVHHAQPGKSFYCHDHTDRRHIGVTALEQLSQIVFRTQFIFLHFTCWALSSV